MTEPILVAKNDKSEFYLLPQMANRHGVITGATGTGKTVTLQRLAEGFSSRGVPVFMADIKGDLTGVTQPGGGNPKIDARNQQLGITPTFEQFPATVWDVFGKQGHPLRATISEMGPLLIARLLQLNETQEGVLTIAFKYADDNGLMLIDLKDLQSLMTAVGENAQELTLQYGNVSAASVGAIQRGLLQIDEQGGDLFFGEPAVKLDEFMQTSGGKGVLNLLAADQLVQAPKLYSTFLLWLLSELFESLPEAGDLDKPKLVFFFDEAHLLFTDASKAFRERIEQTVKLIRSKGIGVFFCTQLPTDIPNAVLSQLGARVQHALRAFTPEDQAALAKTVKTYPNTKDYDIEEALTSLGTGEAIVTVLSERGAPTPVAWTRIRAPRSLMAAMSPTDVTAAAQASPLHGKYGTTVDRESAYERLTARIAEPAPAPEPQPAPEYVPPPAYEPEPEPRRQREEPG